MKRHTKQSDKQAAGQFFTSNATQLLSGYESFVEGKNVIDPFVGAGDLLEWAKPHCDSISGCDISPISYHETRDSLLDPPDYTGKIVVSNPPYLSSNKSKNKILYVKWNQSDLYKCFIASIVEQRVKSGILIVPSNFISESNSKIRDLFFTNYTIRRSDYYYYQVFPGATTGIFVFAFELDKPAIERQFWCRIHYSNIDFTDEIVNIKKQYGWLHGEELLEQLQFVPRIKIQQWTGVESGYLSSIVLGLLDKGKYQQGLSINTGSPIVCPKTAFTTTQLVFSCELSAEKQKALVDSFNTILQKYRDKYHGLFLPNYMGADQKILPRKLCYKIIEMVLGSGELSSLEKYF